MADQDKDPMVELLAAAYDYISATAELTFVTSVDANRAYQRLAQAVQQARAVHNAAPRGVFTLNLPEPACGERVANAAAAAVRIARMLNVTVVFPFNGVRLVCYPHSTASALVADYNRALERRERDV